MLSTVSKRIALYVIFIFSVVQAQTQIGQDATVYDTLLVGIAGSEPFVFNTNGKGIALEIWQKIAEKKSWNYRYVLLDNVDRALNQIDVGDLDLVVGPISITASRLEHMRFSQPFYNSSISIISRIEDQSLWQKMKPLFSLKLLTAILIFLIILAFVGTLLWLAERKESPDQFPSDPLKGIGTGMWLAIVTMSTTGYGDKAPITLTGRIIAGSWMIISIIFATSMVAGIASTLTLSSLDSSTVTNIEQLVGKNVATIAGSPSESFLERSDIKVLGVNDLSEAIERLERMEVDAVVYDRPQLLYYLKNSNKHDLYISKAEYYKQGYGFAFPTESKLILDVNRALLELSEDQETERIVHDYIQKDE